MPVKKILVVDDSPTDRQYMLETLAKKGFQVVVAENGEDAIVKAKAAGRTDMGAVSARIKAALSG